MIDIEKIENIDDKKHIALLDTSSISFMQGLKMKGIQPEDILKDYDLILIPEWVLTEINDAPGRANYVQGLIEMGSGKVIVHSRRTGRREPAPDFQGLLQGRCPTGISV